MKPITHVQTEFVSLSKLAAMVSDGDRCGVGGALFSRLPIALGREITERKTTGRWEPAAR